MKYETIRKKNVGLRGVSPNLGDYEAVCRSFSWDDVRSRLSGLPGGALNIVHEAVDRHVIAGRGERLAMRWLSKFGEIRDHTYSDLSRQTSRFANVLAKLGIGRGERVFSLLGRVPELYIAALGTLKSGAVFSPLFSDFGPEPIKVRMTSGDASVLITSEALYAKKVASLGSELPSLEAVLLTDCKGTPPVGTLNLRALMAQASDSFETVLTKPEDMALLHFTSGTTGMPKGAIHVHQAVLEHYITGYYALDFHEGDIFWCTSDPGWVTGTSYGIISPLVNGVTMLVDEAEYEPERWYRNLQDQQVSIWYT
ncbi:MAG: AMP-binding protein, partial [Alphaproteobacteria bacterium]